jgi:DNA-binding CsgD family transcriptional regulator
VSNKLGISERMLYRYMKSLYEKVGAENRAGLVKRYYGDKQ